MKPFLTLLIVSLLLLAGIVPLHAQREVFKGEMYLGAGAGALFSKVDFVPGVPLAFKQGLYGGISAKYISEKYLGLIMELNFAQRGWKEEFDPSSGFAYSRALNYVELPFMTHVYFGEKTRFILNIGPQVSLLISDNQQMNQALSDDLDARRAQTPEARIGMQYEYEPKRFDYGLVAGIGMELKSGIGDFDLEGRYYFGLGDVFTNRRSEEAYFSRSASRVIEAKLTYYIRIF